MAASCYSGRWLRLAEIFENHFCVSGQSRSSIVGTGT